MQLAFDDEVEVAALSVLKVMGSEAEQRAYENLLDAGGPDVLLDPAMSAPYNLYSPGQFTAS